MFLHPYTRTILILTALVALAWVDHVWAAGAGMPWEGPLTNVLNSISGPVAKAVGIIAISIFGLAMAFGDGGGLRTGISILFGLSIAFAAASWGVSFFNFAGGAVF